MKTKKIILAILNVFLLTGLNSQVSYFPWNNEQRTPNGATDASPGTEIALDINADKIYYIGNDYVVRNYYKDNDVWYESFLNLSAPLANAKSGLVFDELQRLYYIAQNGNIQQCLPNNGAWPVNSIVTFTAGTFLQARSDSKLAVTFVGGTGGNVKIYYVATDNFIHYIEWTNNGWITGLLSNNPSAVKANSNLVTDTYNKVYYIRDADSKICNAYPTGASYTEAELPNAVTVARANSNLVLDENSKLYYVGTDNKMHHFMYTGTWQETVLNANAPTVGANSNFTYNNGNVIYADGNNILQSIYWNTCTWQYSQLNKNNAFIPQNLSLWKSRYINSEYKSSYCFDSNGKLHELSSKIDAAGDFVYVKNDKLWLNNSPYYVKGMNYFMDYNKDTHPDSSTPGDSYFSRYSKYCGCCAGRCSNDPAQALTDINTDFERISNAGFNTIRIIGAFGIKGGSCNNPSDGNMYITKQEDYRYPNNVWSTMPNHYLLDLAEMTDYLTQLSLVIQKAEENNLRVILCTGTDNINRKENYPGFIDYNTQIADYFKNESTLMAIDFQNEPLFSPACNAWKNAGDICTFTNHLYNSIRQTESKVLLTIGLWAGGGAELFQWDPTQISVDFFAPHFYNCGNNESANRPTNTFAQRMNNIKSDIYYWSEILKGKPWVAGEYGFSADILDANDTSNPSHTMGTISQQNTFALDVTTYLRDAGSCGGLWWNYKDTDGSGSTNGEFYGIYTSVFVTNGIADINLDDIKSNTLISNLTSVTFCNPNPLVQPSTYYDYISVNNFNSIQGTVTDPGGTPIPNAYLLGYGATGRQKTEFTYSTNSGTYALNTIYTVSSIGVTAPGYQVTNISPSDYANSLAIPIVLNPLTCSLASNQRKLNDSEIANTEQNTESKFLIYPNPSFNGVFNMAFENENYSVEIFNISGQKIMEKHMKDNKENEINLSEQPEGVYLIKMNSDNKVYTKKIIIQ